MARIQKLLFPNTRPVHIRQLASDRAISLQSTRAPHPLFSVPATVRPMRTGQEATPRLKPARLSMLIGGAVVLIWVFNAAQVMNMLMKVQQQLVGGSKMLVTKSIVCGVACSNELKLLETSVPLVTFGVYSMYRDFFPPEIDMLNRIGEEKSDNNGTPMVQKLLPNSIVWVHAKNWSTRRIYTASNWATRIREQSLENSNIGMYVMADELNFGSAYLNWDSSPWSYVIRDYYFDRPKFAENTTVLQLGTMSCGSNNFVCDIAPPKHVFVNFLPPSPSIAALANKRIRLGTVIPASQRPRKCYWAGSLRSDREPMVEHFRNTSGCDVFVTPGFNQGNKTEYAKLLAESVFALVPRGNSPETHRLAEVILFGTIPVMVDEDAKAPHMSSYAYPIPVISGQDWPETEQRMNELAADPVRLDEMQQNVLSWWEKQRSCTHADVRWIMAQGHALAHNRSLCDVLRTNQ